MKKVILFIPFYFFVSIVNAHSGKTDSDGGHYKHSDGSYHYHGSGGLGDWTGTESIGAWLGVFLVVGFIVWFIKEYPNSKEQYEKEKQSKLELDKKYSTSKVTKLMKEIDSFTIDDGKPISAVIKNGKSVLYYEDGSKLYEGNWINGKQDGISFAYHPDGSKWLEMNHSSGVRNGVFKCWFDTGTDEHIIQCTANFKDGFLDGESLGYYTDGNKRYRELYSGGTFQEKYSIYLGEDGKLITKEQFELQESDDELMEYFTKFNNLY